MNRLAPLIARRTGPFAPAPGWAALAGPKETATDPLADLKLFATGWVGGLVFFGTLLA
ncbi:hypothetical protein [Allosphingosinicella sp.]|uniref:hypothetical protein n=1 Tax=Allosphingosinicella sp. TaxID=2823234 RepID=UPI002FC1E1EE